MHCIRSETRYSDLWERALIQDLQHTTLLPLRVLYRSVYIQYNILHKPWHSESMLNSVVVVLLAIVRLTEVYFVSGPIQLEIASSACVGYVLH